MNQLRVLDLFSGIGGFSLGLERTGGFRTVAFCEIEPFPRKVLAKHWAGVPIFEDVRKLHAEDLPEPVDVICGGYPCQPFSLAGKRKGVEDDRHLWPEIDRLLREFDAIGRKPTWCLFENVAGHVNMGLDQVLSDLESQDYTAWPLIIPACGVDAPHRRDRVWIIANSGRKLPQIRAEGERNRRWGDVEQHGCVSSNTDSNPCDSRGPEPEGQQRSARVANGGDDVADSTNARLEGMRKWKNKASYWPIEPNVGRVAHGVPYRVDRLKSLGNAVVPQVVGVIGRAILEAEERRLF